MVWLPSTHNALGATAPLERLAQEPLSSEVTPLAEPERNRVTVAVDGTR